MLEKAVELTGSISLGFVDGVVGIGMYAYSIRIDESVVVCRFDRLFNLRFFAWN